MKPIYLHLTGALALSFTLAACIPSAPEPAPAPAPTPTPAPPPPPPTVVQPVFDNWMDAPQTPGDWTYRRDSSGTMAMFGAAQSDPQFALRCNLQARTVTLLRAGNAPSNVAMTVRTETQDRTLQAAPGGDQLPYLEANLPARDALLDAMALSKGRFAVEIAGQPTLYIPAWAEVTRVIEDCR